MIQRIQTLFLLLGAISAGFISMNSVGIWEHFAFAFASIISLIILSLFKRRKLQINLGIGLVVPLYLAGLTLILLFSEGHYDKGNQKTSILISFFVGLISTIFAIIRIRKDEKIVQESNRLR
jgi:hypothetical protein